MILVADMLTDLQDNFCRKFMEFCIYFVNMKAKTLFNV